jgi:hypothetical protein
MDIKKKTLRRRVLIREYDYRKKLLPQSRGLYDRVEFTPITRTSNEQEYMWAVLNNRRIEIYGEMQFDPADLQTFMYNQKIRSQLYSKQYLEYHVYWHPVDGTAVIYSRADRPSSVLGWAVLEKDLVVGH